MAKWTEKTGRHAEPLVPGGYETRVYRDGKEMGRALGRTPEESREKARERALDRAPKRPNK